MPYSSQPIQIRPSLTPQPRPCGTGRTDYDARYLVLFDAQGSHAQPRAVLFDRRQKLLAEMVEPDPFTVDTLVDTARSGALSARLAAAITALDQRADPRQARCFVLN
jgi:hypothetical protein